MTWVQRLKRMFGIDIETCERCGAKVKVIASIEDPAVIAHILKYLQQKEALQAKTDENQPDFPRVTTKRQERGKMPGSVFAC